MFRSNNQRIFSRTGVESQTGGWSDVGIANNFFLTQPINFYIRLLHRLYRAETPIKLLTIILPNHWVKSIPWKQHKNLGVHVFRSCGSFTREKSQDLAVIGTKISAKAATGTKSGENAIVFNRWNKKERLKNLGLNSHYSFPLRVFSVIVYFTGPKGNQEPYKKCYEKRRGSW